MTTLAKPQKMIYNVYHKRRGCYECCNIKMGKQYRDTHSGNNNRIPWIAGRRPSELKDGGLFMRKQQSTAQMFEQFYGKPFEKITPDDLGSAEEIDWGEDVGGEVY